MGLFDAFSKIAKDVVKDVARNVIDDAIHSGTQSQKPVQNTQMNVKTEVEKTYEMKAFDFHPVAAENVTMCSSQYIYGDNCDKYIVRTYGIDNDYHKTRCYGGEIDDAYMYYPQGTEDDYVEQDDFQIPYIYIGFDQAGYNVVERYLKDGTVKPRTTIEKVNHSIFEYRTRALVQQEGESCFLSYSYYSKGHPDMYNHIGISYPYRIVGTAEEQKYMDILDKVASTYSEKEADEWNNDIM